MKPAILGSVLTGFLLMGGSVLLFAQAASTPEMIQKAQESVVNIRTDKAWKTRYVPKENFSAQVMEDYYEQEDHKKKDEAQTFYFRAVGSGIILESSGLVLTNAHVIEEADHIEVVLSNRKNYWAKLIAKNSRTDLALLQIQSSETFPTLPLADSDQVKAGEEVYAIGSPYDYQQTVTKGIVSAVNREIQEKGRRFQEEMIQSDVAVNPGNSGGPMLNAQGEMIGLITIKDGRAQGIGFAIPTKRIQAMIPELKMPDPEEKEKEKIQSKMGFWVREMLNSQGTSELVVTHLTTRGSAQKAGIRVGDKLTRLDRSEVRRLEDFKASVESLQAGQRIRVEISRQNRSFFTYLEVLS